MTACDNVALAEQIDGFSEDMTYVQTWVETDALKATTPSGKCRLTLAGLIASASVELSPVTTVESKLWSEISGAGGLFEFDNLSYEPSTTPGQYPIAMFINGNLSFDFTQAAEAPANTATVTATGLQPTDEIVFVSNVVFPVNQSGCGTGGAVQFITLEQFNTAAGTGGNDTAAFEAACALSVTQGKPILLLNKTYLIDPSDTARNLHALEGLGKSSILKCRVQTFPASDNFFDFVLVDGGWFKNFRFDGNLTADPVVWDSSTYNVWGGGRGYRIIGSKEIIIDNVHVTNVFNPGHGLYNCEQTTTRNCTSNRTRGNFGDGFIASEGKQHSYYDCFAYDFTRIGFVGDKTTGSSGNNILRQNCIAIYGHDASILYGGIESNTGFWDEFAVNATHIRCLSWDTTHSGFRAPVVSSPRYDPALYEQDAFSMGYYDCVAGNTSEGFISGPLGLTDVMYTYSNCIAYDCGVPYWIGDDTFATNPAKLLRVLIQNCKAFMAEGVTGRAVLPQGGDVSVDGLDVYYKTVPDWQAVSEVPDNGDGTIGWFGDTNNRPRKLTIRNLRSFNANTKQPIQSRISQGFTTKNNEVVIEDCDMIFMDIMNCYKFISRNVTYSVLGTIAALQVIEVSGGGVAAIYNVTPTNPVVVAPIYGTTFTITFDNVRFNLPDNSDNSLYVVNINSGVDTWPKVRITRCRFRKNFTTGSPISVNADAPLFDTNNIMRFIVENNLFINTGGSSSNPLVRSLQREVGANTVNVQVMGKGNFRSNNTAVLATSGVITTNFEALPYDGA